jgi:proline iminopeptidase
VSDGTPEPFDADRLEVGDGHVLAYEQVGNPDGPPVLYLHGGPGSGCTTAARRFFHPDRHRAVLVDQRGAGRSSPHASEPGVDWASIDMDHHLADIERLRRHLGVERWAVLGVSWGAVLAATYAQRHTDHVTAVVLVAASTGTPEDVEWLTVHAGAFFPAEWEAFRDHVPAALRSLRLVDAYHALVMDPVPEVHGPAALAWCRWEDRHTAGPVGSRPDPRYDDPRFRLGFARQVTHHWRHAHWLGDDELVRHAPRLAGTPGWLVHGRLDVASPVRGPWRLHRAWPGSELVEVADDGHGGPAMFDRARARLAALPW